MQEEVRQRSHCSDRPGARDLDWDATEGGNNTDLDLWVFDTNGNKARAAANAIPNSSFSQ